MSSNVLVEKGIIEEMKCGKNFSYILSDQKLFSPTDYKVLHSQEKSALIKCIKMLYNGKLQFYYLTSGFKTFANILPSMNADVFCSVVGSIFRSVLEVKNNGFLSCTKIASSFEQIFIEANTNRAYLLYLPINVGFYSDDYTFENELRASIVKLILGISTLSSPKTMQLLSDLQNGNLSLEEINARNRIGTVALDEDKKGEGKSNNKEIAKMKLVAMNLAKGLTIEIDCDEFVIGRNELTAGGKISPNKMISRPHCMITTDNSEYYIEDLNSSNGTFLNKDRIKPGKAHKIVNGDIIRLANVELKAVLV